MSKLPITLERLLDNPELPSLPEAFLKLNDFIKHDRPIAEITKVIERDPSLSARSLKLANSAWYKRSRTIASVKDAITTIGLDALHQLVFATSVIRTFYGVDKNITDMQAFWNQSMLLACNAKLIRQAGGEQNAITLFTSGIVAYVGKLVIYLALPEASRTILENCRTHPHLQHLEEIKVLGFSHNQVTSALLQKWQLPETTYVPIQYYTEFSNAPVEFLPDSAALFLAHQLVFQSAEILDFANADVQQAIALLHLSPEQLPDIQQQAAAELAQAATILDFPANQPA